MTTAAEVGPLVEVLEWDTAFWGVKAARIRPDTPTSMVRALDECRTLGVQWVSLLAAVDQTRLIDSAIRADFDLVDLRVTMSRCVDARNEPSTTVLAQPAELAQAHALVSGAFSTTRFAVDEHFDRSRCDEFYRTWVTNSFSGHMADAIVASHSDGLLDAFVTIRQDVGGAAALPLVAVRADRRGMGVGARVVQEALDWLGANGSTAVTVVTQLANVAAIRMYESVGFSIHESAVWLHHWLDQA